MSLVTKVSLFQYF
uniref:Uncharacterized protein n=1 Tax=Rhizophora mucronata TaxID=61149 RepID=A0A2P2P6I9_RHIMU